jgi:hypothetical protein
MAGTQILPKQSSADLDDAPTGKVRLAVDEDGVLVLKDEDGTLTPAGGDLGPLEAELAGKASAASVTTAKAVADAALPKAGGTMTGLVILAGDPTANLHPATKQWTVAQIAALINGAPGSLDTLKELADALGGSESALAALVNTAATKSTAKGIAVYTGTVWPTRPAAYASVEWQGPAGAGKPSGAIDGDTLLLVAS